jgi:hypothetical protein
MFASQHTGCPSTQGRTLPKGVIRASWSRTQKHRRKREMRICCKQRLRANSSCICDRVRFLRRRLHSRWGTTTWTRDPLRSQPHKRYTDLCQSYTYLSYDDNLWYDAPALMQYRPAARRLLGSSNRSFSRHFYISASAHHRHQQWIHFTLKWPLPHTWRPARLNILVS